MEELEIEYCKTNCIKNEISIDNEQEISGEQTMKEVSNERISTLESTNNRVLSPFNLNIKEEILSDEDNADCNSKYKINIKKEIELPGAHNQNVDDLNICEVPLIKDEGNNISRQNWEEERESYGEIECIENNIKNEEESDSGSIELSKGQQKVTTNVSKCCLCQSIVGDISKKVNKELLKNIKNTVYYCDNCLSEKSDVKSGNSKEKKPLSIETIERRYRESKPLFTCNVCSYSFKRLIYLKKHEMQHKEGKITSSNNEPTNNSNEHGFIDSSPNDLFKCDQCSFTYKKLSYLNKHKLLHSQGKDTISNDKHKSEQTSSDGHKFENINSAGHNNEQLFKCDECLYTCKKFTRLKKHKLLHLPQKINLSEQISSKAEQILKGSFKRFKCDQCSYSCQRPKYLLKHKLLHTQDKTFTDADLLEQSKTITSFECTLCFVKYKKLSYLKKHERQHFLKKVSDQDEDKTKVLDSEIHNSDNNQSGYVSEVTLNRKSKQLKHFIEHKFEDTVKRESEHSTNLNTEIPTEEKFEQSAQTVFKCEVCSHLCKSASALKIHLIKHSTETPFACDQCSYSAKRESVLKIHKLKHLKEKLYKCDKCSFTCNFLFHMNIHKVQHSNNHKFLCTQCSFTCDRPQDLKKHRLKHAPHRLKTCDQCSYSCERLSVLKVHKLIHSNERMFKCDECSFSCKQKPLLQRHKRKHWDSKIYNCEKCSFKTNRLDSLKAHQIAHTVEKSFKCPKCPVTFKQIHNLKRHQLVHSNVKLFNCDQCSYACNRSNDLKKHKVQHSK